MNSSPAVMHTLPSDGGVETLTVQAYQQLRTDILGGRLIPGEQLKIASLCKSLGIGASPIREALSLLTSDALVDRFDKKGFRVADVSLAEFLDLQETRCWMEERALCQAIEHGNQDWEEAIVLSLHRLSRVPRQLSKNGIVEVPSEWDTLHRTFHFNLISACPSNTVLKFCEQLYDRITRYRNLAALKVDPERNSATEHKTIADAVIDRDKDLAVSLLLSHYEKTEENIKQFFSLS